MGPIEELREEHGAIMKVFSILQAVSGKMDEEDPQDPLDRLILDAFRRILEFLKVFVDQCHHAKEEELLFPAMTEAVTGNRGLIEELISEHEHGRRMIRSMEVALSRTGREGETSFGGLAETIKEYLQVFRNHIRKENAILFPEARDLLSHTTQSLMAREFERIEEERIGKGRHEAFHRMIEELGESVSSSG
jgi:hemerythrin-like domain-containing protein